MVESCTITLSASLTHTHTHTHTPSAVDINDTTQHRKKERKQIYISRLETTTFGQVLSNFIEFTPPPS